MYPKLTIYQKYHQDSIELLRYMQHYSCNFTLALKQWFFEYIIILQGYIYMIYRKVIQLLMATITIDSHIIKKLCILIYIIFIYMQKNKKQKSISMFIGSTKPIILMQNIIYRLERLATNFVVYVLFMFCQYFRSKEL